MLDQRRPLVPGRVGRRRGDIVALEPRNRDRGEIRDADLARKGAVSEGNSVENAFVVADEVHLVHREHDMPDTEQMREEAVAARLGQHRSEEHTSELQSLMRISYAVFCLKKKNHKFSRRTALANSLTRLP